VTTELNRPRAVIVFSGGQDSTTVLYYAKAQGFELHTVSFDYGQRHRRELESAKVIAEMAGVASHEVIPVPGVLSGTSPLVSDSELEQYESAEALPGGIEKTFVPMRNQLFLTIAANRAYCLNARHLFTGVGQADYGGYPDCRQRFIESFEKTCNLGTFTGEEGTLGALNVVTPLMHLSKRETVMLALDLPGCYEALAFSHTSYNGEYPPTSQDHASLLRAKGFADAGVPDPLMLCARMEGLIDTLPNLPGYNGEALKEYWWRIDRALADHYFGRLRQNV
jgi:7-cyano-7-deazaguanine synthase